MEYRAVAVGLLLGLCLSCGGEVEEVGDLAAVVESVPRPAPKMVLIGLDGADWGVIRPLMDEGKLPVLASLVREGTSGDLESLEPTLSPALWTTMVTGVRPERHGIRDFVYKEPGSYTQPIVNASVRRRLALWNIFSALGLTVGVVDWYATWPAEEVNGFIVSDRIKTLGAAAEGVTYPAFETLEEELSSLPSVEGLPALARLTGGFETLPPGLDKALKEDLHRYRIVKSLYGKHRPDFFAFYLKGLDAVGHFYWKYHEPDTETFGEVDEREAAAFGSIIPDYYALCDQIIGDFLELLEPGTTVLVVSDHGFRAFGRPDSLIFDLDRLFWRMELLEFEDPATAADRKTRRIRMDRTRLYSHEGTKIVSGLGGRERPVYLNVAGRDPEGAIEADGLAEARAEIVDRLKSLRTGVGSRVFSEVRVDERPTAVAGRQEPDLYLRVNAEIAFEHDVFVGGRPFSLFDEFFWEYGNISGSHRLAGILIARGPSVRAGATIEGASILDVTPTLLHLAGAPVPEDLDGKPLQRLFRARDGQTGLRVASYEDLIERAPVGIDSVPIDEEYRERLRALGYVQ